MGLLDHFKIGQRVVSAALWFFFSTGLSANAQQNIAAQPGRSESRPNIVFVLLDDVRYDDIVDHPFSKTPNIERLAREGSTFTNFFTSAPLCSPSRAVFLTGKYPHRNGIIDNGERASQSHQLVTFPRLLHDAGYRTGFFGKWHMGHEDDSARPGFDRWVSFVGQGVYFDPVLNIDGKDFQAKGYMSDILTEQAISFIESSPRNTPFLVFLAHKASHPEVHPNQVRTFPSPPADATLYQEDQIPRSPSYRAPLTGKPALKPTQEYSDPRSPPGGLPDSVIKDRLRMLQAVDRGINRLRSVLEKRGVLDETIFVITSDQGFFYGEFGLAQERRLAYESSIRIPLIVRYPDIARAGSRPNFLLGNVDIAPSLLEMAKVPVPKDLDGKSMVKTWRGEAGPLRSNLLVEYYSDTEFPRLQRLGYQAIRTERYKFIRYRDLNGVDELYDLRKDPFELDNLLRGDISVASLRRELSQQLDEMIDSRAPKIDHH